MRPERRDDTAYEHNERSGQGADAETNVGGRGISFQEQVQERNMGGRTQAKAGHARTLAQDRVPIQEVFGQEKTKGALTLPLKCAIAAALLATIVDSNRSGEDVVRIMFGVVVYLVAIRSTLYQAVMIEGDTMVII